MTAGEIIKLTEKLLKDIPCIRKRIKLIDVVFKKDAYDVDTIKKLKIERNKLHYRLSKVINAVKALKEENQKIICYRYFDKLIYKDIAIRIGCSTNTVPRRINKILLKLGRSMFGFEDEFWNKI